MLGIRGLEPRSFPDPLWHVGDLRPERLPVRGHPHEHPALVGGVASAGDQARPPPAA